MESGFKPILVSYSRSLGVFLLGFFIGYVQHEPVKRVEQNLFYANNKPAIQAYQDPYGLKLETRLDDQGMVHIDILHSESSKSYEILKDMMPPTKMMLDSLESRSQSEDLTDHYDHLSEIQKNIFKRCKNGREK